jgi:arylsulfatase A-like enzyme
MPWLSGQTDWLRFERAYVNQALCCPARSSLLTGQYAYRHGVTSNRVGFKLNDRKTVAVSLDRAGYKTGLFGKYMNGFPWHKGRTYVPPGWDRWNSFFRRNGSYFDYDVSVNGRRRQLGDQAAEYSTDYFARRTRRFIRNASQPFFAVYAPKAPHGPALAAPRHAGLFETEPVELPPNFNQVAADQPAYFRSLPEADADEIRDFARRQWETTLAVDEAVQDFSRVLARRGIDGRTFIFFLSDNGLSAGSHRLIEKNCLYEECVRVPMLIRAPGRPGGVTSSPVSEVDLAPTFADLASVRLRSREDGDPLTPYLLGDAPWPVSSDLLIETHDDANGVPEGFGVVSAAWKYMAHKTGERELYHLSQDPFELDNLADDPAYDQVESEMAARLRGLRR